MPETLRALTLIACLYTAGLSAQPSTSAATATGTGIIQGTATDGTSHKPVSSVVVTVLRAGVPPFSQTATTGPDGKFDFEGLPAGTYKVCGQAPALGYLNPCEFGSVPLRITLTAGQKSTNNLMGMVAGATLHVRIQDPQQLAIPAASVKAGIPPSPDISVGVWGGGSPGVLFFPARLTGTDSTGLDYQIAIPQNIPLALHISSRHLKLSDATGAALVGNTSQKNIQHNSADPASLSLTYSVAGVLP